MLTPQAIADFQEIIWGHYRTHKRDMPWRDEPTPYNVLVSEIMLQQTQVPRVLPKFIAFMAHYPTLAELAAAPLADVLTQWSGLGYNRRAKFLHEAAKAVVQRHAGTLPDDYNELVALPGIGPNTAGAILAYAFERPAIFIETNIRTVIIYHFFADHDDKVTDAQIREIMQQTIPTDTPREWYWALMDYGTHVKATAGGQLQRVQGYKKQSKFQGSRRQIRGQVLKTLLGSAQTTAELNVIIVDDRLAAVLADLQKEGLVARTKDVWHLTGHDR